MSFKFVSVVWWLEDSWPYLCIVCTLRMFFFNLQNSVLFVCFFLSFFSFLFFIFYFFIIFYSCLDSLFFEPPKIADLISAYAK